MPQVGFDASDVLPTMVVGAVVILLPILIVWCVSIIMQARSRREAQRLEFQSRVLERVGSTKEFGEFLATEQGQRFLDALTPPASRVGVRAFDMLRWGMVLLVVGVALLIAFTVLHAGEFGHVAFPATLLTLVGLGMMIAARVSYSLARKFGLGSDAPQRGDRGKSGSTPSV